MRRLFVAFLMLVVTTGVLRAEPSSGMPRSLGDAIHLGMTQGAFAKRFSMEPTRCASCYRGELLAQPTLQNSPDVARDLRSIGLSLTTDANQVDLFFEHGKLAAIHVEGLTGTNVRAKLDVRFGKGHVVQNSGDLAETEWSDRRTRLRLTKWESEYQLTLSENDLMGKTKEKQ